MSESSFNTARECFLGGLAALEAGDLDVAETRLRRALELAPGRSSVLNNLAVTLLRQSRPAQALPLLDQLLAQEHDDVEALGHRGAALSALQRHAEARDAFAQVLERAPDRAPAWFFHGQALQQLGALAEAVASYDRCLALVPGHGSAWSQRGCALRDLGRGAEADASWQRAIEAGDDPALNAYYRAAASGQGAPAAPPRDYVQRLFDDYAGDFDRHLVEVLGYSAPETLQRLLLALPRSHFASALDLGCGTGLCGPLLRPLAGRLVGLDLSPAMAEAARARGCYDEVLCGDMVEHLSGTSARYDLLVAADVFIYVGNLAPVFAAVAQVLQPGGVFAFSAEPAAANVAWQLQPSLRYAHGASALRALGEACGLRLLREERAPLRVDQAGALPGLYLLFER